MLVDFVTAPFAVRSGYSTNSREDSERLPKVRVVVAKSRGQGGDMWLSAITNRKNIKQTTSERE